MRFQRLEMQGFKSFVEKTVIEIGEGLTAVVGPNGCGKSNVCDAVRWVLGEQAPRNMRSKRMEDVIFNGSAERKQLGMAEVSICIADLRGVVTSPAFKDFDEVVVTRRLYRSGESEYLINRNPCRLKDIVDLFLDTGVSLDTFSIVEQGKIESLVNARPLDRRILIEEAAGIMKYKSRRNEALRKLDLAQANLLRVADIMGEKEARLRSLRRQARKAAFHKEYRAEVAELSGSILTLDYIRLADALAPVEEAHERVKEEERAVAARISSLEAEREGGRILLAERAEALAESRRRAVEAEGGLRRLESQVEMLGSRLVELDAEDARRADEIRTLDAETAALAREKAALSEALETLAAQADQALRGHDAAAAELAAARGDARALERALGEARRAGAREGERLSAARQRVVSVESRLEGLAESAEKMAAEAGALEEQLAAAGADVNDARGRVESLVAAEGEAEEALARAISRCAEASGALRRHEASAAETKESLMEARSALSALEGMLASGATGAADLEAFRACGARALASLSDLIRVEPRLERAIEAALGEALLGVVVRTPGDAAEAIRALAASGAGRGVALPVETSGRPAAVVPLGGGVLGAAADFVRCGEEYRHLMASLLENVVVTEDIDAAQAAWCNGPEGVCCVTLAGEIIRANGAAEGGLARNEGFLERARRREETRGEVERLEARRLELAATSRRLGDALERAERVRRDAVGASQRAEVARVEAEGALRLAEDKRGELKRRLAALADARRRTGGERMRLADAERAARDESLRAEEAVRALASRTEEMEEKAHAAGRRHSGAEARLTEGKVALTEINGRVAGGRAEAQRLADGISRNAARKMRAEKERRESAEKRARFQETLARSEEEVSALRDAKSGAEAEGAARHDALGEAQSREEELGGLIREARARASALQNDARAAAERRTTLRVRRESMLESAESEYGIRLEEAAGSRREALPRYQEMRNRLEMLNQRLARMGEVNPLAAQEYDEINQEYAFLQAQQQDLESSIADLHATVGKLNRTTKARFLSALDEVGSAFADIFGRLFEGGEARMYLLDPDDPLESGVDIEVRPPGKRPSNIMLLSAGEKALTALSLLFAVFSVRPSPFCILDEVDATLDDANVARFREVIAELERRSQFIIITHNKKTMSYASQLYGVTQREKGVSEIVSVRLNREDAKANGAGRAAAESRA